MRYYIKKRILDFDKLTKTIEQLRANKNKIITHKPFSVFPNKKRERLCIVCNLPHSNFLVFTISKNIICYSCFNLYIDGSDYLQSLENLKMKIDNSNKIIERIITDSELNKTLSLNTLKQLFKDKSHKEIEQIIGTSITFLSFDFGIEAAKCEILNQTFEIWLKNGIFTNIT